MSKVVEGRSQDVTPKKIDRHSIDREEQKKKLRYQRDKDREMVKGIFRFYEVPGGTMTFSLKLYKEDEVEKYELIDGLIYSIPLGVARHLNKNGWYPIHAFRQNENGVPSSHIGKKVRRFGFQSLEFIDHEDLMQTGEPILLL